MRDLLVRNVNEVLLRKLRQGARDGIHALAAALRKLTRGRRHTAAEALIREGRDQR